MINEVKFLLIFTADKLNQRVDDISPLSRLKMGW